MSVLRNFLALIENLGIGAETLVVFVLHDFLDVHIFQLEVQLVVRFGVDGKPVLAVDLLPPGGELGKEILLVAVFLPNVGDGLAIGLHNLEIVIVDPDASLEVALLAFDLFGCDVEDVAIQFVFLLLAGVDDVVFRQVFGSQHERQAMSDIFEIFLRHKNLGQTRLRRKHHVLDAMPLVVEHHVEDFVILAVDRLTVHGFNFYVLAIGVLVARLGKFRLFCGEALDHVLRRRACGRSILERPLLGARRPRRQSAGQKSHTK